MQILYLPNRSTHQPGRNGGSPLRSRRPSGGLLSGCQGRPQALHSLIFDILVTHLPLSTLTGYSDRTLQTLHQKGPVQDNKRSGSFSFAKVFKSDAEKPQNGWVIIDCNVGHQYCILQEMGCTFGEGGGGGGSQQEQ